MGLTWFGKIFHLNNHLYILINHFLNKSIFLHIDFLHLFGRSGRSFDGLTNSEALPPPLLVFRVKYGVEVTINGVINEGTKREVHFRSQKSAPFTFLLKSFKMHCFLCANTK